MTASTMWLAASNKDTSVFKSIHNAIIATGIVATADTGQLDMTTAPTYNTTTNTVYGYTVYKFNDAAQSTSPIFFKISWENGTAASPTSFIFRVNIGTGSNGTGTITGTLLASTACTVGTVTPTVVSTALSSCIVSGDGSGICVAYACESAGTTNANVANFFLIERGRNSSGTPQTTSVIWQVAGGAGQTASVWSSTLGIASGSFSGPRLPALTPWMWATNISQASGGVIPAYPIHWMAPTLEIAKIAIVVDVNDFGELQTFTVTHLGATHTYMAFTNATASTMLLLAGHATGVNFHYLAVLYE